MKVLQVGVLSIWLSGLLFIALNFYATRNLTIFNSDRINHNHFNHSGPKIAIFTAPAPFIGSIGSSQSLAMRSWLGLSPQITVLLFTQHPSAVAFARDFGSRLMVEPNIDFTDWLLVASSHNVSRFPFYLSDDGKQWLTKDGRRVRTHEFQEILDQSQQGNLCEGKMLMAWNSGELPLNNGVFPPFLFGKGTHNPWVISEALLCELRFVFDASLTVSSFSLNDPVHWSNQFGRVSHVTDAEKRNWEYVGNSHLGALYGSSSFHEINSSCLAKVMNCYGKYNFVNMAKNTVFPVIHERPFTWKEKFFHSSSLKKTMACVDDTEASNRRLDCSLTDQLKTSAPLDYPFPLESLLSVVADKNRTVVLAVAGYSYKDMLMSWVCRLRLLRVTNFVVCALDHETYQFSILQGLPVFNDPSAPSNISFNDCHFGTKCFQRVTKVKSRIVLQILKLGYNVLLSDVDVYWFRNPLPLLYSFGLSVLAAQSDEHNRTGPINLPRRLNSGFYFARSNNLTIAAMEKVVKHAATSGLSEQPSFYDTLCGEGGSNRVGDNKCVEPETNLTVHFLDRKLFPNGAYLDLWLKKNVKGACAKIGCLVLHNNWISGRLKKLERQVLSGLWEYDITTRMCIQSWHKTKLMS
ncbi:beta-arabinofuranosyltransferase RAY1 isoform X3 [Mangifera indica]|uniref:beta-arabinofuranosyltransferase RAY1 isoform X3 n=1 Tax=Mangifera indica TaxID=29780 RepID=UPI001CFC11A6|nr:beta-arabinofuranosyltransferase RAY1 isoform X3 [Mangifera indica]